MCNTSRALTPPSLRSLLIVHAFPLQLSFHRAEVSGGHRRLLEGAGGRRRAPEGAGGRRKARRPKGAGGRRRAPEGSGEHRAQKDALECAGGRRRAPGGRQRPPEAAGGRRRPPEGARGRGRPPEAARGSKSTPQPKRASCGNLTNRKGDISLRKMEATKTGKREGPERQPGRDGCKS